MIFNPRGSWIRLKKNEPIYDYREIDKEIKSIVDHIGNKYPSAN